MLRRKRFIEATNNLVSTKIKDFISEDSTRRLQGTEEALSTMERVLEKLNKQLTILAYVDLTGVEFVIYDNTHSSNDWQLKLFTDCSTPTLFYKTSNEMGGDYLKKRGFLKSTSVSVNAEDMAKFALSELNKIL